MLRHFHSASRRGCLVVAAPAGRVGGGRGRGSAISSLVIAGLVVVRVVGITLVITALTESRLAGVTCVYACGC